MLPVRGLPCSSVKGGWQSCFCNQGQLRLAHTTGICPVSSRGWWVGGNMPQNNIKSKFRRFASAKGMAGPALRKPTRIRRIHILSFDSNPTRSCFGRVSTQIRRIYVLVEFRLASDARFDALMQAVEYVA
eukprot:1176186-Prorocentrum_minimum.AAC.2